ncbi:collagen alpha-1(I) chain-like [Loxodonta africana]|uniref:collagen alpha-1(I) chain-like n=1 Tax=Loxodonta africana TaxID=9785 RepID=UPI0030CB9B85
MEGNNRKPRLPWRRGGGARAADDTVAAPDRLTSRPRAWAGGGAGGGGARRGRGGRASVRVVPPPLAAGGERGRFLARGAAALDQHQGQRRRLQRVQGCGISGDRGARGAADGRVCGPGAGPGVGGRDWRLLLRAARAVSSLEPRCRRTARAGALPSPAAGGAAAPPPPLLSPLPVPELVDRHMAPDVRVLSARGGGKSGAQRDEPDGTGWGGGALAECGWGSRESRGRGGGQVLTGSSVRLRPHVEGVLLSGRIRPPLHRLQADPTPPSRPHPGGGPPTRSPPVSSLPTHPCLRVSPSVVRRSVSPAYLAAARRRRPLASRSPADAAAFIGARSTRAAAHSCGRGSYTLTRCRPEDYAGGGKCGPRQPSGRALLLSSSRPRRDAIWANLIGYYGNAAPQPLKLGRWGRRSQSKAAGVLGDPPSPRVWAGVRRCREGAERGPGRFGARNKPGAAAGPLGDTSGVVELAPAGHCGVPSVPEGASLARTGPPCVVQDLRPSCHFSPGSVGWKRGRPSRVPQNGSRENLGAGATPEGPQETLSRQSQLSILGLPWRPAGCLDPQEAARWRHGRSSAYRPGPLQIRVCGKRSGAETRPGRGEDGPAGQTDRGPGGRSAAQRSHVPPGSAGSRARGFRHAPQVGPWAGVRAGRGTGDSPVPTRWPPRGASSAGAPSRLAFWAPDVAPRGLRTTSRSSAPGSRRGQRPGAGSARTWAGEARGREGELAGGAGRGAALAQLGAWQWGGWGASEELPPPRGGKPGQAAGAGNGPPGPAGQAGNRGGPAGERVGELRARSSRAARAAAGIGGRKEKPGAEGLGLAGYSRPSCPDITPSPRRGPAFALCPPRQPLPPLPAPGRCPGPSKA